MPPFRCVGRLAAFLVLGVTLLITPPAGGGSDDHPQFPRPTLLHPNIQFWKQVYTEYGVGDFVLHDRQNLGLVYEVVRVKERSNQARAEELARPEIQRLRAKYDRILSDLALGTPAEQLGPDAARVAQLWGCPCGPETLLRAAGNIRVQQGLREKVDEGLQRAKPLMPRIVSILKRYDVPAELAALPLVESTFNPKARSKAGAVGLWQFIKSTGQRYLRISRKRDDRHDPIRATEAAARLLRDNYDALGSWPLAIIAYNHGHAGIQAASASVGSKAIEDIIANYSGPRFGFASKNFYAEFLAALDVVHPLLDGQTKPALAKARRQDTKKGSLRVQPTPLPAVIAPAPPVPVEAPVPAEAPPPASASLPPAEQAPVPAVPPANVEAEGAAPKSEASIPPAPSAEPPPAVGLIPTPDAGEPVPAPPLREVSVPDAAPSVLPEIEPPAPEAPPAVPDLPVAAPPEPAASAEPPRASPSDSGPKADGTPPAKASEDGGDAVRSLEDTPL